MKGGYVSLAAALLLLLPMAGTTAAAQSSIPTLFAGPIWFADDHVSEGEDTTVFVNVTNIMPFPQTGVSVILYQNMLPIGEESVNLTANETQTIGFPWTAARGYNQFTAVAYNPVMDTISPPFSALMFVNSSIVIESIGFSEPTPVDGDPVDITVTLFNDHADPIGNLTLVVSEELVIAGFRMHGGDDIKVLYNETGISLQGMERRTYTVPWTAVYGNKTFFAEVLQDTPFGNETLATDYNWIVTENAYDNPAVAAAAILAVLLGVLMLAVAPSVLDKIRSG